MEFEAIKEYFDLFITNYLPQKDKQLYQQIINFLLSYYYDTYNEIPNSFKLAYENQIIPNDFLDPLLLSNGFPDYIIKKLNLKYKTILLQSFMDFNRYKGTIYSFKKVSSNFDNVFNVYELFLSRQYNQWVFLPYLIYKHPNLEDNLSKLTFNFNQISEKTKYFLLSEENLNVELQNDNLILPVKTNLILLDYYSNYSHESIVPLYNAIVLNHFKDYKIIITFFDNEYKTNLMKFISLWYYIFYKFYNNLNQEQLNGYYIVFNPGKLYFPFFLGDLLKIQSEYENINSREDIEIFNNKYLNTFRVKLKTDTLSNDELLNFIISNIPKDLLDYVNQRLVDRYSAHEMLTELYNSIVTWSFALYINNPSFQKDYEPFINTFIAQLPLLYQSILDSTSYLIIEHFKPYHAELILNENVGSMKIEDKFNKIYMDNKYHFDISMERLSLAHQSSIAHKKISIKNTNSVPIIHDYNFYADNNPI